MIESLGSVKEWRCILNNIPTFHTQKETKTKDKEKLNSHVIFPVFYNLWLAKVNTVMFLTIAT